MDNSRTNLGERLLAFVLAVVMVLSLLPAGALQTYAEGQYTLTVTKTGSGVVKIDGVETNTVSWEADPLPDLAYELDVTPAEGWKIASVTVDGVERVLDDSAHYTGAVAVEAHNIEAAVVFTEIPPEMCDLELDGDSSDGAEVYYKVDPTSSDVTAASFTEKLTGSVGITKGKTVRLFLKAKDTAIVTEATDKGASVTLNFVGADAWFDLTMSEAHKVKVSTAVRRTVTAQMNDNAVVTLSCRGQTSSSASAAATVYGTDGDEVTIQVKVKDGKNYLITGLTASNYTLAIDEADLNQKILNTSLTLADKDSELTAQLEARYDIILSDYANGTVQYVKGTTKKTIESGGTLTLTAEEVNNAKLEFTPDNGYVVADLSKIGSADALSGNKQTGKITRNLSAAAFTDGYLNVTVAFKKPVKVELKKADHGTVTMTDGTNTANENGSLTVFAGDTVTVTATPDSNYILSSIRINGTDFSGETSNSGGKISFVVTATADTTTIQVGFNSSSLDRITISPDPASVKPVYKDASKWVMVYSADVAPSGVTMKYNGDLGTYDCYFNNNSGYKKITGSSNITKISWNAWGLDYSASGMPTEGLYVIFDGTGPEITLADDYGSEANCYGSDVEIKFSVEDPADALVAQGYAGLWTIFYYLDDDTENPEIIKNYTDYPQSSGTLKFTVFAAGSDSTKVTIVARDKAGNETKNEFIVHFNSTVSLKYTEGEEHFTEGGMDYYPDGRTATVSVRVDSESQFNSANSDGCISFAGTAVNSSDVPILGFFEYVDSAWTKSGPEGGPYTYSRKIRFIDAKYDLQSITYTFPLAEGEDTAQTSTSKLNSKFVVDTVDPTGVVTVTTGAGSVTYSYIKASPSNRTTNGQITFTIAPADATSGVAKTWYYVSDAALTSASDFTAIPEENWTLYTSGSVITLTEDGIYVIGVKILDKAGHVRYISTDKYFIDTDAPSGSITATVDGAEFGSWDAPVNELAFTHATNQNVTVTMEFSDIPADASHNASLTGLASYQYYLSTDRTALTQAVLEALADTDWADYTGEIVLSEEGYYVIGARVEDNAGNVSYISSDVIIVDKQRSSVSVSASEPFVKIDSIGVYGINDSAVVTFTIAEKGDSTYSGIQKIESWIVKDGVKQDEKTEFSFDVANPTYSQLYTSYEFSITVDKETYNSCNVGVYVKVTDAAGNEQLSAIALDIDNTKPVIQIDYLEDQTNPEAQPGYYTYRTATVTIIEREHHFDPDAATDGIVLTGENNDGPMTLVAGTDYAISSWTTVSGETPDACKHVATISFYTDSRYELTVNYTDRAGNAADEVTDSFTIDATAPEGTISAMDNTWSELLTVLTFGLWKNETIDVTATAEDATSPLLSVSYYKETERTTILSRSELEALGSGKWTDFDLDNGLPVPPNEKFTVYLRIVDYAGNVCFICTNGLVADDVAVGIELKPNEASGGEGTIYNMQDDPQVELNVLDLAPYSGIKSIRYWIEKDGVKGEEKTPFTFNLTDPTYEDLINGYGMWIPVDKVNFNSCNVEVFVEVIDNAGNVSQKSVKLDIDNTAPVIKVEYLEDQQNPRALDNYFIYRTATVTITERTHHFEADKATEGIEVVGVDANGTDLKLVAGTDYTISDWTTKEGATADEATHTAVITFLTDANYTLTINYTDRAGNAAETFEDSFTLDATKPEGTITAKSFLVYDADDKDTYTWDDLISSLTFDLFSGDPVTVSQTNTDATSPILSVSYYRTSKDTAISESDLLDMADGNWISWGSDGGVVTVNPDARVVMYLRIIDNAGNIRIISTDGFIVDQTLPKLEDVAPIITITPPQPVNDIYNADVPVKVDVVDPDIEGSYSGIRQIRYEVRNMGTVTQEGVLYSYSGTAATQADLLHQWTQASAIVVDAEKNNSNDVAIIIYAVDNSNNSSEQSVNIKIDITKPVIKVSYDNNNGDTAFADGTTDAYFNANRTATIEISERNFDPNAVVITLTNTDGVVPALSGWHTEGGTGNGDNTRHIATLTYAADGDYTFDISCKDLAGNANEGVEYNGLAPQKFTIDKTAPVINVDYDPADSAAQNGNYFPTARTATITITEHNFETSRIAVTLTATDDGNPITLPAVVGWTSNGNTHVATISYEADARYTFDISYRDKAGNEAADYDADTFYVDKTLPEVKVEGIVDESANNSKENIGFILTATDTNMNVFEPKLTGVFYRDGQFVTETIEQFEIRDIKNGKEFVVENLPEDGIYTLTCTVIDMAGNAFDQVTLFDADGNAYTADRTSANALVSFSVNRQGSVYNIDDATADLIGKYYVQHVKNDVVLIEINTDEVNEHTVTLNGKELAEGTDYTVTTEGGNGQWVKYIFTVNQSLFEQEGAYNVVVSSHDKADNNTYSDVKGAEVKFVVDYTAPVVIISGLENDGRYQTEAQVVTLIPTDDGGALRSIEVLLVDENGNVLDTLLRKLEGEELTKTLEENDGKLTFTVGEGLFQNVRIICDDWADYGDEENIIYDETIHDVSVSTSPFKIFWANKPLRWGTIGGVGGLGLAGFLFLLLKKRKKDEEKEKAAK